MNQYFAPYLTSSNISSEINVDLDMTNYAIKDNLKSITHVNTSSFALKTNLSSLKTEADQFGISKLSTAPADLAKLTKEVQELF